MLLFLHIFVTDGIRERTMKLNKIYSAILLSTLPLSAVQAAGLDRSGQSISAFLQPGNYAEAGISVLDPEVQGKDNAGNYFRTRWSKLGRLCLPSGGGQLRTMENWSAQSGQLS